MGEPTKRDDEVKLLLSDAEALATRAAKARVERQQGRLERIASHYPRVPRSAFYDANENLMREHHAGRC